MATVAGLVAPEVPWGGWPWWLFGMAPFVTTTQRLPERRLAPSHRDVVIVSDLGGLSDPDTADALGASLGSAKIRLHRAQRAPRGLLECECRIYRDERNELACEPVAAGAERSSTRPQLVGIMGSRWALVGYRECP
jgi:hypothetical protein